MAEIPARAGVARTEAEAAAVETEAVAAAGDPMVVGLPMFLVGSVALGLTLIGYVSSLGAVIPIVLLATGLGLLIATVWAAALGQSAVASVFGTFTGFWLSYGLLLMGTANKWFGVAPADATRTTALFLIAWLVVIGAVTLSTARLPVAYTVLLLLVDVALALVLAGVLSASTDLLHWGGYAVFAFVLVGLYLLFSSESQATGGPALPLGPPLMR